MFHGTNYYVSIRLQLVLLNISSSVTLESSIFSLLKKVPYSLRESCMFLQQPLFPGAAALWPLPGPRLLPGLPPTLAP